MQAQNYPLEGLLLDEPSIYHAMDTRGTGAFVPLSFSAKTGEPTAQSAKARLADREKFNRIPDHLDGMLTDMAKNLYSGEIDAAPLVPNAGKSPCLWCEYRTVCRHADGEGERTPLKTGRPVWRRVNRRGSWNVKNSASFDQTQLNSVLKSIEFVLCL